MTCQDVAQHWDDYLVGCCDEEIAKKVEAHLQRCERCQEKLERALNEQETKTMIKADSNHELELSVRKQKRILARARWKQRISTGLFWLSIFIIFTLVSSILSGLYYGLGKESRGERMREVMTTMTEMTMPNMTLSGGNSSITPYFGMKSEYTIMKQVGKEHKEIGLLQEKTRFSFSNMTRHWYGGKGLDIKLYFLNPTYPFHEERDWYNQNWQQLEKVKEGTVAEVALSLDRTYSLEEVDAMFLDYDFYVTWLAIDTGQEQDGENNPYLSVADGIWGMPTSPWSSVLNDSWQADADEETIERFGLFGKVVTSSMSHSLLSPSEQSFKRALAFLKDNQSWAVAYPHGFSKRAFVAELERVETYVNERGVNVYGVVVTGPTEEILQLKDHPAVTYVTVDAIDWWNWNGSHASGTIYY